MKITNNLESHNDRAHAEFSASVADRILNCSQSVLLSRKVPKLPGGPDAIEGTRLHEITEQELETFFDYLRNGPDKGCKPFDYTKIEEPLVNTIVEHVYETILEKQITQKHIILEQKIHVSKKFKMFGTADLIVVHTDNRGKRCGIVVDYKFGRYEVEIKNNPQLAYYAVGLLKHIRKNYPGKDLDYVRCIVLQPKSEEVVKEIRYTTKQLESWDKKFLDAARNIYELGKFKYKVGKWCHYCPGKVICPKFAKDLEEKSCTDLVQINNSRLPAAATLPFEQVEKIAFHANHIRRYLADCEDVTKARISKGKKGKFMKVVRGDSRRSLIDDTEKVVKGLIRLGVPRTEIVTESLLGVGAITTNIIKRLPITDEDGEKKSKKDLKIEAEDLLSRYTIRSVAGTSLVPLTHKKPAIQSALDVFSDERPVTVREHDL